MKKKNLNCAVIGMGVGERHANFYKNFTGTKLVKIYEKDINKIKFLKKKYPNVEFVFTEDEIFKDRNIDTVSIASYDNYHARQILKCIKTNKNIFVEKPLCLNLKELRLIRNRLMKSNINISSNLILRGLSKFKTIENIVKKKQLGKIYYMEADYNYGRLYKIKEGWRSSMKFYSVTSGGGIHMIDQMVWLLKEYPYEVEAEGNKIITKDSRFKYNDFTLAILKFKSGILAKISSNFGCKIPHHHVLNIYGSRGTIINNLNGVFFYKSEKKTIKPLKLKYKKTKVEKNNLIKNFSIKSLNKKSRIKNLITKKEILNSMLISLAIDESIKKNKKIKINYNTFKLL